MTRRLLWVGALAVLLAAPGVTKAGEVRLTIKDGRVDLVARDATLREILLEWERVGGTKVVNRDRVPGTRLNIELSGVPEAQALATVLRPIAGYMASRRLSGDGGASAFSRIILMAAAATPASYPTAAPAQTAVSPGSGTQPAGPPFGRPGVQRRVLPDGRVVTVMDDPDRSGDPDDRDEAPPAGNQPGMMRPPFGAPPRQQGQPGDADQPAQPQQVYQPGQALPTTAAAPVAPTVTVATPGALPVTKPATPPPIKPPGE